MHKRPYIDPTSAAAEALGPPPPAQTPAAWQQASSRPRPRPAPRRAPRPVTTPGTGYFKAHWLGEHSLARSYWVNNMLVATPLAMLLTGLMSWISVKGDSLQLSALVADADSTVPPDVVQTALQICRQPLEMLARRDVRRLTQACTEGGAAGEERTRAAMALIARLEPRPGRRFVDVERNIIIPDVIVRKAGRSNGTSGQQNFIVSLNPDVMPRLRVHDIYAGALRGGKGSKGGEGHAGLQQRLQEARWFIKNIQQRFDTILRVSRAIVERQKSFFTHGELAMRPLVLRDIADELGLHESTISRVTTAKYMATPIGTYELKYFFGSGLGTETGGNASSTAVRALIKQFVAAESPTKPLSDSQLAEMLKEQGIECARRTVAKYREALKIAPANLRKAL